MGFLSNLNPFSGGGGGNPFNPASFIGGGGSGGNFIRNAFGDLTGIPGGNLLNMAGEVLGFGGAGRLREANAAPFNEYRGEYGNQLMALSENPSSILDNPGYKFGLDQGLIGRKRALAAGGYSGSGNELLSLEQYAQDYAGRYLSQEQARLAKLAGADITPNFAPQLAAEEAQTNAFSQLFSFMKLAGLGK